MFNEKVDWAKFCANDAPGNYGMMSAEESAFWAEATAWADGWNATTASW